VKYLFFISFFFVIAVFFLPIIVYAQQSQTPTAPSFPYWGPLVSCEGSYEALYSITTPVPGIKVCRDLCDVYSTVQRIIYFAMTVAILFFAPAFLVIGGILMIVGGSTKVLQIGKGMLKNTIIGIAIALSAFLIVNTFLWLLAVPKNDRGAGGVAWPGIVCHVEKADPLAPLPKSNGSP
jgi:hypothetical protein